MLSRILKKCNFLKINPKILSLSNRQISGKFPHKCQIFYRQESIRSSTVRHVSDHLKLNDVSVCFLMLSRVFFDERVMKLNHAGSDGKDTYSTKTFRKSHEAHKNCTFSSPPGFDIEFCVTVMLEI